MFVFVFLPFFLFFFSGFKGGSAHICEGFELVLKRWLSLLHVEICRQKTWGNEKLEQ